MLCSCCHPRPNQPQLKIQSPWMLATDFQHQTLLRCLETWWRTWVWKKALLNSLSNLTRSGIKGWRWREKIGSFLKKPRTHVWCGEVICPHMVGWKLTMFRLQAWLSQHLTTSVTSLLCIIQDAKTTIANTQFAKDVLLDVRSSLSHTDGWLPKTTNTIKYRDSIDVNWVLQLRCTWLHIDSLWKRRREASTWPSWTNGASRCKSRCLATSGNLYKNSSKIKVGENSWNLCKSFWHDWHDHWL